MLGKKIGGWESWYSYYTSINEAKILTYVKNISSTPNIVNEYFIKQKRPAVFQIDDGWQKSVGDWDVNTDRFPLGLKAVTEKIRSEGLIPGIWVAPLIVDMST